MNVLRRHYPEYLMEDAGIGLFMISASVVTLTSLRRARAYLERCGLPQGWVKSKA
jgi:hypothetical protein